MKKLLTYTLLSILIIGFCFYEIKCKGKRISENKVKRIEKLDANQVNKIGLIKNEDTTTHIINENGVVVSNKKVAVGNIKQIKTFYKIPKGFDENKVENVLSANVSSSLDLTLNGIIINDSIIKFDINQECYKGTAEISGNNLHINLNGSVSVNGVIYWKHKYWFGKRFFRKLFGKGSDIEYNQKMWSDCPNVQIDSISSIMIIKGFHN